VPEGYTSGDADFGVFGNFSIFSVGAFMDSFQVDFISESEKTEDKLQKSKLTGDQRTSLVSSASILILSFCVLVL